MGDAIGEFLFVVGDKNERLVRALAELFDDLADEASVAVVEAMKGFVEDEQFWVFHEGAGKEAKPLFAAAELQERLVG